MTFIALYFFPSLLMFLIWAILAILNFWVWSKTKALGNLLMLCGAGVLTLAWLITMVATPGEFVFIWLPVIGTAAFAAGFFLTIKPLVEAQLAGIKDKMEKLKEATSEKDDKPAAGEASESSES